jgi:hypothetical protein
MNAMRAAVGVLLVALLALPAAAVAEHPASVEAARAAHGSRGLSGTFAAGDVIVSPAEGIASVTRTIQLRVTNGTPVEVDFPARFSQRAANGRPFVRGTPSGATLDAGSAVSIDVSGLPAGTYRLPLLRGGRRIGNAVFRLYTPTREGDAAGARAASPFGRLGRIFLDTSNDTTEESETFVAADPADPNRIVTAANDITGSGLGGVSVTTNGGTHPADWTHLEFPTTFAISKVSSQSGYPGGDPILAADDQGDLWAGGLSLCDPQVPSSRSHIFVNRISFPNGKPPTFQSKNAAIPALPDTSSCPSNPASGVVQDKPMMTIDNWPASPTYGRLYVTWDDPDANGGMNVVMSYCDTRPTISKCDDGSGWSAPAMVSDQALVNGVLNGGSYISSDPAVGPDGTLYVVWWDYSAANAIRIDACKPGGSLLPCLGFGPDGIVASLSEHFDEPVPFACPTMAQPGGRAGPVPSVATDSTGRIYVAWGDLGTTGATRCGFDSGGSMTYPDARQDAFNAYVASADTYAHLTADPASTSGARGTNVFDDPGDHWFPWVAVDRSSGQAYVALYSTRADSTRRTANYYVRAVVPDSSNATTQVEYGAATKVSDVASDYSDQACGLFGNDYGDYSGLAAATDASGPSTFAIPVWDRRPRGATGEVYIGPFTPHADSPVAPADNPPLPPMSSQYLSQCTPPPPPPPPPPTTTTTTTTTTTPPPPVDRTPPTLRVTFATRVDRRGRYTLKLAPAREAASGSATLRLATGGRRKLASGLLATSGVKAMKLVLRLSSRDLKLLKRRHKLRVRLTVSLTDVAGNTARGTKAFTLRPSR